VEQPFDSTIATNLDDGNEIDEANLGNVKNTKKPRQTLHDLLTMEEETQASSKYDTIVESGTLVSSIEEYSAFR
jgi:hypothetical protein